MSDDVYQWVSGEANDHSMSNFGFTPIELVQITGPTQAKSTLMRTLFDFRCYVATGLSSPPPERWISWVEQVVVLWHEPGAPGSPPSPFSDDPRIIAEFPLEKLVRTSPSLPSEYTVEFRTRGMLDFGSRRVGSGSAFTPSRVTATMWSYDPGFDMDGVFAYSTAVNWWGMLRTLYLIGT